MENPNPDYTMAIVLFITACIVYIVENVIRCFNEYEVCGNDPEIDVEEMSVEEMSENPEAWLIIHRLFHLKQQRNSDNNELRILEDEISRMPEDLIDFIYSREGLLSFRYKTGHNPCHCID